jgi:hypothetical protein
MRFLTWCLCLFASAGLGHSTVTATSPQTGTITGTVVTDETPPRPVRRAVVTATAVGLATSYSTVTDDEGRFTLERVPMGSYTITASRSTFITSAYGAQRPARRGRSVAVAAGELVSDLVVRLWRGAVISGTVRDEQGRGVPGQRVRAIPAATPGASFLSLTNNPAVSDTRGEFRIFGLEPGDYYLAAQPDASPRGATLLQDAYIDQVLDALRQSGRGVPRLKEGSPAAVPTRALIDSPVYWPGTVHASQAVAVTVGAGLEKGGLDLNLIRVPAADVSGRVTRVDGTPAVGATVRLTDGQELPHLSALTTACTTVAGPGGVFEIDGVPAGTYQVSASITEPASTAGAQPRTSWAVERLQTSGESVRDLALRLRPGLSISGRIRISDGGDLADVPRGVSVALMPANVGYVSSTASLESAMGGAAVRPDGTFVIPDLRPEVAYRLFVNGMGGALWPVSAVIAGADLFDGPTVIGADHSSQPLAVTFSRVRTEIFGTLAGDSLISPIFVVVFPANRSQWGQERRTRAMQPDVSGGYRFENLPPGEYWIGAIGDVDAEAWKSPSFLELLQQQSLKVVLGHGERRQVDLRTR